MRRVARIVRYICAALALTSALVAAAVASNQILNDDKWVLGWAAWAFGLTLLGLLLTLAWEHTAAAGDQSAGNRASGIGKMSRRRYRRASNVICATRRSVSWPQSTGSTRPARMLRTHTCAWPMRSAECSPH
ncbi:hypothetical protein [Nonomuraea sp. NPDC049028]|uniref:hypothetical protein n=1 Tax=Nonomuraea sp. NPDC049028 TaxID=3364348 RepID=UPI0037203112